jgi:hypothetical protein
VCAGTHGDSLWHRKFDAHTALALQMSPMRSSLGVARPANAQTFGVQAGVSLEPNQFYFGGRVETPPLADVVHVRPNMQWALGDGGHPSWAPELRVRLRVSDAANVAVVCGRRSGTEIIRATDNTRSERGSNFGGGVSHRDGHFAEVKVGVEYVFR